jgi:hypothetical protein
VQLFGVNNKFGPFQEADVPMYVTKVAAAVVQDLLRHGEDIKRH